MPKNVLQDVMPPQKRSIRNIPLSSERKRKSDNLSNFSGPIEGIRMSKKKNKKSTLWLWIGLVLVIVVALVGFTTLFAGAKVVIVPKQEKAEFQANLPAVSEDSGSGDIGVPYKILTLTEEGFKNTSNATEKRVDKKASGDITVFNNYNSSSQRLVKNTRFETSDGLIYRVQKSVVVPGKTVKNGETIPGSVTVTVYADSPGEEYNIGLVDFTIPGFAGTDRFDKFFARSKTEMTGGYSGVMKVIDEDTLDELRDQIHNELTDQLKESVYSQIPEGFVLYSDGIYIDFEHEDNIDLGDSVQVVEKGILKAVIFDKLKLSNYLAKNVVNLDIENVEILNIDELTFSMDNKDYIIPWEQNTFTFNIEGNADFASVFDEEKIKQDLAGQSKRKIDTLLSNYDGIKEAEVIMSPFWKMSFPSNPEKIEIEKKI